MPNGSETDPFEDLRATLEDEEEPFITVEEQPDPPVATPAAAPGPPPLPPKRSFSTPEMAAVPPPPSGSADPFHEPPEPRPPKSGALEEKVEYFRVVLRQKQDTLSRARSLFAQKEAESIDLRASVETLTKQVADLAQQLEALKEASAKGEEVGRSLATLKESARSTIAELEDLRAQLSASEDERRELSKGLAEAEAETARLTSLLEEERQARLPVAEELKSAKKSRADVEARVAELSAAKSEIEGAHEALNEQYFSVSAENERLAEELSKLGEEVKTAVAERESANAELNLTVQERDDLQGKVASLENQLDNHSQTTRRVAELEQSARASEEQRKASAAEAERLRREFEAATSNLGQERARAEAAKASANQELQELRRELETRRTQFKQQLEQERKKVRDDLTASFTKKLLEADQKLETQKVNYAGLEAQLSDVRRDNENYRQSLKRLEQSTGDRSNQPESPLMRKLREELAAANKKAADAVAALQNSKSTGPGSGGSAALVAERDQLRADIASMKKKLVAAETAIEAAASLKAKVSRLEAELKKNR